MKVMTVKLPSASAKGGSSPADPSDGKTVGVTATGSPPPRASQVEAQGDMRVEIPAFVKSAAAKVAPAKPAAASVTGRIIEGRASAARREGVAKADMRADPKPAARQVEPTKAEAVPAGLPPVKAGFGLPAVLKEPRIIGLLGGAIALAVGAGARIGFNASLLESVFWAASFAGLALGGASFVRVTGELSAMRRSLDHTRKHMATTARVLSETLEQAETLNALSREAPPAAAVAAASPPATGAPAEPANNTVHLEGLVNVARAQVILAHKSEADMSVLSTLVSNLAEAVGEQEKEIAALRAEAQAARQETAAARAQTRETAELVRQLANRRPAETVAPFDLRLSRSAEPGGSIMVVEEAGIEVDPVLVRRMSQAFAEKSYGFALQPVVTLPQRKIRYYEMSLSLGAGMEGSPELLGAAAREANLAARYDRLLVSRALRMIRYFRSRQRDITILCEVTGAMLAANPAFDELVAELRQDRDAARALVIAFPHRSFAAFGHGETDLLRFFTELGIRFGVMRLTDMKLDPGKLARDNVRFVGVDVARLLASVPTGMVGLDVHVADLAGLFARRDIDFVVQNIATEQQLLDIMDFDASLGQGPLLGEQRPVNPELLNAAGEADPVPTPPPAPAPVERQPLRNFLRRA